jgi:phenylpyruvate tautomerase PptA (4-oxalocrotonate tautomerase family)
MPLINVKLIEDVFASEQKEQIVERRTAEGLARQLALAVRGLTGRTAHIAQP